jgi:hypothetical protein
MPIVTMAAFVILPLVDVVLCIMEMTAAHIMPMETVCLISERIGRESCKKTKL